MQSLSKSLKEGTSKEFDVSLKEYFIFKSFMNASLVA